MICVDRNYGLLVIFTLALIFWTPFAFSAKQPEIILYPSMLYLGAGESGNVWVKIINDTKVTLNNLNFLAVDFLDDRIKIEKIQDKSLFSGQSLLTRITVTNYQDEPIIGSKYFELTYQTDTDKKGKYLVLAELKLEVHAMQEPAKLASIDVTSTSRILDEYATGFIFLIVRNIADRPIVVDRPISSHPDYINVNICEDYTKECSKNDQNNIKTSRLLPGEQQIFKVEVTPSDHSRSGDHTLLFKTTIHWFEDGKTKHGSISTNHIVEIGVIGESTLLTLFGVPSFLVLPGFLVMTSWLAVYRWFKDDSHDYLEENEIVGKVKTREFWLCAITISLIAAFIYPVVTNLLGHERNYLRGYGSIDLVYVWLSSILLGSGMAIAIIIKPYCLRKWYEPQFDDEPLTALRKAKRSTAKLKKIKREGEIDYFIYREKGNLIWVAPQIRYEYVGKNEVKLTENYDNNKKEWDLDKLIKELESAINNKAIKVYWYKDKNRIKKFGPICKEGEITVEGKSDEAILMEEKK